MLGRSAHNNTSFGLKCNHQPTNIHAYTKSIGKTRFFAYFLLIPWCNICEQDKHNTYYIIHFFRQYRYISYILNVNNFFVSLEKYKSISRLYLLVSRSSFILWTQRLLTYYFSLFAFHMIQHRSRLGTVWWIACVFTLASHTYLHVYFSGLFCWQYSFYLLVGWSSYIDP